MATLTTSWKSYASSSVTISGATVTFYLEAKYNSPQNTANNTTVINTRLRSAINSGSTLRGAGYSFTCSYCTGKSGSEVWSFTNETILSSGDKTITHGSDGKKTLSLSATAKNTYWGINKSLSASVDLPTINRKANITSAPNFNDTNNPTIKYSNPAGNSVSSLQAGIFSTDGMTTYASYRDISKTGTSYTFNLTETERNNLRAATPNSNTFSVKFYVKTVINGTTYRETSTKTLTIVNANPTETTTFLETNQKVIELLDSSTADTIIQNVSSVRLTSIPTTLKSATVSKVLFKNGTSESPDTSSPYEATITPTTNTFTTTVTDSRANSVTNTYTKTMIEYLPVDITSFSFKRVNPTSSNILLNAEIRYKQATFNETTNVPTIKWKMGEQGQENTLSANDYTIDTTNNKITITNLLLSNVLPYTDEGRFYLYVNDLLTSDAENTFVTRGIPTFEAGEYDFQVNGELYIADDNRQNRINVGDTLDWLSTQNVLWNGASYMNEVQTIDLTNTPISSQPHGIVLVWCIYENGQAQDWSFAEHFVSKKTVSLKSGKGHNFWMATSDFGSVANKYLYITDTSISGTAQNTASGTASGISYRNNRYVLRYVIGV